VYPIPNDTEKGTETEKAGEPQESVPLNSIVIVETPNPDLLSATTKTVSISDVSCRSKTIESELVVDLKTFDRLGSFMLVSGKRAFSVEETIVD
jgi:hypothetical protein